MLTHVLVLLPRPDTIRAERETRGTLGRLERAAPRVVDEAHQDGVVKRDAQVLHDKAVASFTVATTAFNSPIDTGRVTQVLLGLQHAFEMLLKAALVQHGAKVFNQATGRSDGFETCLGKAIGHAAIRLSDDDAGTLRAIDAMRDDEQHWFNDVSEQLLYRYARAAVTLFDELLERAFKERLANHLPERVLPISTEAPQELTLLLDKRSSKQITDLLKPGRRARDKARARIRTLLAMEAHEDPDTKVSSKDVDRVERGIKAGKDRAEVFPKLEGLSTDHTGSDLRVQVHFTKAAGAPVRFVSGATEDAAGIREVDLQKKYHWSAKELSDKLTMTGPRSAALRIHLGVDTDPVCFHDFVFGRSKHRAYSDNAFTRMRDAKSQVDLKAIWAGHGSHSETRHSPCAVDGCMAAAA